MMDMCRWWTCAWSDDGHVHNGSDDGHVHGHDHVRGHVPGQMMDMCR